MKPIFYGSFIAVLLLLIYCCNLNSQDGNQPESYISINVPFEITNGNQSIVLPDDLRQTKFKEGRLVIYYFISGTGNLEGINIGVLQLRDKQNNEYLDYVNENLYPMRLMEYPKMIQPYMDFVFAQAIKRRIVQKNEIADSTQKYLIYIKVDLI